MSQMGLGCVKTCTSREAIARSGGKETNGNGGGDGSPNGNDDEWG
jgi:hypothetical protein